MSEGNLEQQVASLKEQLRMCRADLELRTRERDQSWRNVDELKTLNHANYEAIAVLSSLSSWVGNGLGEDTTSAADYEARIRDGVDRLVRMETAWKAEQTPKLLTELDMLLSYAQAAASRLREAMKDGLAPEDPYVVLVAAETRLIAARAGIVNVWVRQGGPRG